MKMNQRDFFKKRLGVGLKNPQWSWGAFDPASNRVFLRLWKNQIETGDNGERVLVLGKDWNQQANGYPERLKHIESMERGGQGLGILCEPRISKDGTWHIDDYDDKMLVRLGEVSREGNAIYAEIIGRLPISELANIPDSDRGGFLVHKITRISYNSENWQRPTGDARKYEASSTYNHKHGFGHEDWLFRSEWLVDGWRYAFIEGVNKSERRLVASQKAVDLTLFTIEPDKRRRYVAMIREVECLGDQQAGAAVKMFKEAGWFDTMLEEIKKVGGDAKALGNSREAKHVLNVRFRLENVVNYNPEEFANPNDPIMRLNRYQLYDFDEGQEKTGPAALRGRKGSESAPGGKKVFRRVTAATEYTPEHALMQKKLLAELKHEFPGANIVAEQDYVDVSVRTKNELLLFEIKSDLEPRVVIRQALGQILEYAFHPQRAQKLPVRLIIVGRCSLSPVEQRYLDLLRREFMLPLEYRVIRV